MSAPQALDDLLQREQQLRAAALPLYVLLGLAALGAIGLVARSPVLGIVGWIGGWLIGLHAVSRAAAAAGIVPALKYALFIACAVPLLVLAVALGLLVAVHGARGELARQLRRAEIAQRRSGGGGGAGAGTEAPGAGAAPAADVKEALPIIRVVAALDARDGELLKMRIEPRPEFAAAAPDAEQPPLRATAGLFGVGYRVDAGSHWRSAGLRSELRAAGMTLEQLHKRSLANLMQRVKGRPGLRVHESKPYAGLLLDGENESSLVLLDGVWEAFLKDQTPNGAVVAIPLRDVLMFCDAASREGIDAMRTKLAALAGDPKLISGELLLRRGGRWQVLPAA
jgi:hypothetical protein